MLGRRGYAEWNVSIDYGKPSSSHCCHPRNLRPTGLTKLVSKLSKEGAWRKALEVFDAVEEMG